MIEQYTLRHMFQGTLEGEHTPIFFTRDTEHLLGRLPKDQLEDAIAKGWVSVRKIQQMADLRQRVKDAKAADKASTTKKGGTK